MWIEMIMHMSGTRANGDRYPPAFTPFQVDDWEGEHLVRGGMAREAAVPEWAVPVPPAPLPAGRDWDYKPAAVPPSEARFVPGDDPEPGGGPAIEDVPLPAGPPPPPAAGKQAWVDYAVSQGMSADDAGRMTKIDLQSRFGPRL